MQIVTVPVSEVGKYGIVTDKRGHELPLNAWTAGNNFRPRNLFMEKFLGESTQMGTPLGGVYALAPAFNGSTLYWLYLSLTNAYAWNGTTHFDITRAAGGNYAATVDGNWVITNLMGLLVMTNGVDTPQMWKPVNPTQQLLPLTSWDTTITCKAIRAFKNFLIALDITKASGATRYPQMVKWSHGAAAGDVPSSWDETDTSKDAGEYSLTDSPGYNLDGATLRDIFVIYKEDAVWGMQYVGGPKVFRFFKIFDGIGGLSRRCAVEFFDGKHAVFGTNDVFVHDGHNKQSIVDERVRSNLYSLINPNAYQRCFTTINWVYNEVWFCFPSEAATLCNKALVWNWTKDTVSFRDLPTIASASPGILLDASLTDSWASASGDWLSDPLRWSDRLYNPSLRRLFLGRPSTAGILLADDTTKFEAASMTAYLERKHIGVPFRVSEPPDLQSMKLMTNIWPRIEGTDGGQIDVYLGASPDVDTDPTYQGPFTYTIGSTRQIGCRVSGRLLAVKFQSTTDIDWRIHGYELAVRKQGKF